MRRWRVTSRGRLFSRSSTIDLHRAPISFSRKPSNAPNLGCLGNAYIGTASARPPALPASFQRLVGFATSSATAQWASRHVPNDRFPDSVLEDEKNALHQVYDYAARYLCIPTVTVQFSGSNKGSRWHFTIEMFEHNLRATAVHSDPYKARLIAAIKFKKAAEEYHANSKSLVLPSDGAILSADTRVTKDFFSFCRANGLSIDVQVKSVPVSRMNGFEGIASLNGEQLSHTAFGQSSRDVEALAKLVAAVTIARSNPTQLSKFKEAAQGGGERVLPKSKALVEALDMSHLDLMSSLAERGRHLLAESPGPLQDLTDAKDEQGHKMKRPAKLEPPMFAKKSDQMRQALHSYDTHSFYAQLRHARGELPMSQCSSKVLELVENAVFSVIVGATGSGKTTQVPQILLDKAIRDGQGAGCNVVCTQPRRIAATSVAARVADERGEKLQQTVGYHVRFDAKLPRPHGSILYCTTGILLQQLQHDPDGVYDSVSHLVIDEVHERDMIIDFLLIVIKTTLAERALQGKTLPRVILMSATIDTERFTSYFSGCLPSGHPQTCPALSVPGRMFPVEEHFLDDVLNDLKATHSRKQLSILDTDVNTRDFLRLEKSDRINQKESLNNQEDVMSNIDWEESVLNNDSEDQHKEDALVPLGLVAVTIAHIAKTTDSGAILVFLPGLEEILAVEDMLMDGISKPLNVDFSSEHRFRIYKLHSSIPDSQKTVFKSVPEGCRKIILSTNIAETSVTIPDVQFVVDTGKSRQMSYDQHTRISSLNCSWVSRSNVKQRAGRAGRVQNGHYYALYSRRRHESMSPMALPELLRSDLQETCLNIKAQAFQMPVAEFLAAALDPPAPRDVEAALDSLISLGAISDAGELTPLGRFLASLPVHPSLGKMIVLGIIFRCLDPIVTLGAAMAERPLMATPVDVSRRMVFGRRKMFAGGSQSDHFAAMAAFYALRNPSDRGSLDSNMHKYALENFLHLAAYKAIRSTTLQVEEILVDAGLVERRKVGDEAQLGGSRLNENSQNAELVRAILLTGLDSNIVLQTKGILCRTASRDGVIISSSSVNFDLAKDTKDKKCHHGRLMTYSRLIRAKDGVHYNLYNTTVITPLILLLFGRKFVQSGSYLQVDNWLNVKPKIVRSGFEHLNDSKGAENLRWDHAHSILLRFRTVMDKLLDRAFGDLSQLHPDTDRGTLNDDLVNVVATVLQGAGAPSKLRMQSADATTETYDPFTYKIPSSRPKFLGGSPGVRAPKHPVRKVEPVRRRPGGKVW